MSPFFLCCALTVVAVVLNQILARQGKDFSVAVSLCVCCLVAVTAMEFLKPVLSFLGDLEGKIGLDMDVLSLLLRCVGMAILTEFCALTCADAGEQAMGKTVQLLGTAAILYISLPLLQGLLDLLERILGKI